VELWLTNGFKVSLGMLRRVKQRIVLIVSLIIAGLVSLGVVLVAFQPLAPQRATTTTSGTNQAILSLIQTIPIPNVAGRIDHMDIDLPGQRLFVAALGNNSVFVVDLASGRLIRSITGFNEPQGVVYIPQTHSLLVSNGGNGTVDVIDTGSFSLVRTISFSGDADNMRYDPTSKMVYVSFGVGYGAGVGVINATNDQVITKIDFGNHPESFQVEENGTRIFANVPTLDLIMVANKSTGKLMTSWPPDDATAHFPMALDEKGGRLFVGTWSPPRLLVFDSNSGKLISSVTISTDADDIYYDSTTGFAYVSCGEGFLNVVGQTSANIYAVVDKLATREGARTSLFVPALHRLFVVARAGSLPAAILIFEVASGTP